MIPRCRPQHEFFFHRRIYSLWVPAGLKTVGSQRALKLSLFLIALKNSVDLFDLRIDLKSRKVNLPDKSKQKDRTVTIYARWVLIRFFGKGLNKVSQCYAQLIVG
jgi:hypothetical protein